MSKKDITRRDFMKAGLSCLMGAAVNVGAAQRFPEKISGKNVSRTSLKELTAIPTTCEQCPAGCGVIAYLDGDRLVQILGNPKHPNNRGGICAKGIAGVNLANDPERLLYPLKREGRRGEGKWVQITWDEVYHTLAERLSVLSAKGRLDEFVWDKCQDDPLLDRFLFHLGIDSIIDRPTLKNWNHAAAMQAMIGQSFLIEDVAHSRMILNFGANPFANHDRFIALARRLVQARTEKGAQLITFDVRMSETAAKSDVWHPLRAGTDGIIALAMAKVILERGLIDTGFLKNRTDTSPDLLQQHLSPYTLEKAEKESGVSAPVIQELAIAFATQKPSVAIAGGGITDHENGIAGVGCVALLNWIVGNLEEKGGLFSPRLLTQALVPPRSQEYSPAQAQKNLSSIRGLPAIDRKIDTYFLWAANPAYTDPENAETNALLQDESAIPFLAVMDTHLTETA
ncbi:MAG: molybdopterin-dependent oxidoreductase, partial [Candidatus Aminicenantes bacterium]|nr:molybdopterin-dependent oxidoreductase [Candidatus Aminicenantes bacterium]